MRSPDELVVQGVYSSAEGGVFILCDPAIHFERHFLEVSTNMRGDGITGFFSRHECNHICEALKLSPHAVRPPPGTCPKMSVVHHT
jgi:hypothetical protein